MQGQSFVLSSLYRPLKLLKINQVHRFVYNMSDLIRDEIQLRFKLFALLSNSHRALSVIP